MRGALSLPIHLSYIGLWKVLCSLEGAATLYLCWNQCCVLQLRRYLWSTCSYEVRLHVGNNYSYVYIVTLACMSYCENSAIVVRKLWTGLCTIFLPTRSTYAGALLNQCVFWTSEKVRIYTKQTRRGIERSGGSVAVHYLSWRALLLAALLYNYSKAAEVHARSACSYKYNYANGVQ